jgi:hypothetical protein
MIDRCLLANIWRYGWFLCPRAEAAYRDLVGRAGS